MKLVANRVADEAEASNLYYKLNGVINRFLDLKLEYLGIGSMGSEYVQIRDAAETDFHCLSFFSRSTGSRKDSGRAFGTEDGGNRRKERACSSFCEDVQTQKELMERMDSMVERIITEGSKVELQRLASVAQNRREGTDKEVKTYYSLVSEVLDEDRIKITDA